MSAREDLFNMARWGQSASNRADDAIDAYRAEVLREAAGSDRHHGGDLMTDRRERYAAAIYKGHWPAGNWALLSDGQRGVWREAADAVIAVADAEYASFDQWAKSVDDENTRLRADVARKDREYATCERLLRESYDENTRLRAELDDVRERPVLFDGEATDYAIELGEALAAISRVRAACDREESRMIDPDKASLRTSAIRAALDAPNG